MKKALFIDRDGTINIQENGKYVFHSKDFKLVPNIVDLLKRFQDKGYLIIVITNQGCIDKALCNREDVIELHKYIIRFFGALDVRIFDIMFCPHHPSVSECNCRKPQTLMFDTVIKAYNIDVENSYAIGDNDSDLIPAKQVGVKNIYKCETNNIDNLIKDLFPC